MKEYNHFSWALYIILIFLTSENRVSAWNAVALVHWMEMWLDDNKNVFIAIVNVIFMCTRCYDTICRNWTNMNRPQALIWTNSGLVCWRIHAPLFIFTYNGEISGFSFAYIHIEYCCLIYLNENPSHSKNVSHVLGSFTLFVVYQ